MGVPIIADVIATNSSLMYFSNTSNKWMDYKDGPEEEARAKSNAQLITEAVEKHSGSDILTRCGHCNRYYNKDANGTALIKTQSDGKIFESNSPWCVRGLVELQNKTKDSKIC